jgi:hypothetical protein
MEDKMRFENRICALLKEEMSRRKEESRTKLKNMIFTVLKEEMSKMKEKSRTKRHTTAYTNSIPILVEHGCLNGRSTVKFTVWTSILSGRPRTSSGRVRVYPHADAPMCPCGLRHVCTNAPHLPTPRPPPYPLARPASGPCGRSKNK